MDTLPSELLEGIFAGLAPSFDGVLVQVCHRWRDIVLARRERDGLPVDRIPIGARAITSSDGFMAWAKSQGLSHDHIMVAASAAGDVPLLAKLYQEGSTSADVCNRLNQAAAANDQARTKSNDPFIFLLFFLFPSFFFLKKKKKLATRWGRCCGWQPSLGQ